MHEYLDILFDSYLVDAKLVIGKKPILIEIHEGERMQEAWAIWNPARNWIGFLKSANCFGNINTTESLQDKKANC